MPTKTQVLVIGGGPAGITFCRTLKKLKPHFHVTMLRPEEHSMIYCAIPYAIQGLFEAEKVYKKDALVTSVGTELVRAKDVGVDLSRREVTAENGTVYQYETLLIATGANPFIPPIPGSDASNVFTVKTQQDMLTLIRKIRNGAKQAVVIGAGAIGIEQAQAYQENGVQVYLVDMADRVLPAMIDLDMAEPVHQVLEEKGIRLILSAAVQSLETTDGMARRVVLNNGQYVDINPATDFVCFAVGVKPDVELFHGQGLEINRDGIVVDAHMRTNVENVYAAGDCCSYVCGIDDKTISGKLATNAVPMAKTAARNVAGIPDTYPGFFNGAATCVYHLRIGGTGMTEELAAKRGFKPVCGFGRTSNMFPMMPGASELQVKIVADAESRRVLGGQVLSQTPATDKVDVITLAIQQKLELDQLAKLSYSAQPWQSFFPARNAIVEACENALDVIGNG